MQEEKVFEIDGRRLYIKKLNSKMVIEAQKVYTRSFKQAIEDGAILKKSLEDHMRRQGLWDDAKQEEYRELIKLSADIEFKIKNREYTKASELRDKSIELKKIRDKISALMSVRNSMDSVTADGRADNDRFSYFVAACVYDYETKKPVFSSMSDYEEKMETDFAIKCAEKLASHMYGIDEDYEDHLVENRILKRLGLLDEEGYLVNAEGKRVDLEGNLLDAFGSRIDKDGNRVDINNNPLIDDSVIDDLEFEDDLGLGLEKEEEEKPKTRKRNTTK